MPNHRNNTLRRSKRIKMEMKKNKKRKQYTDEDDFVDYPDSPDTRQPTETLYINDQFGIKQEIDDSNEPRYELIQNYTNEFFLVPMSEENEQTENELPEYYDIKEDNSTNENKAKKAKGSYRYRSKPTAKSPGRPRKKVYAPPDLEEQIIPIVKTNSGLKKTEVPCNENFHLVDVFSIFGKSVGDQLRSFPMAKAMTLQNKIQDLITQATEESFRL